MFGLAGCGNEEVADPVNLDAAKAELSQVVLEKWSRSCSLCHVNGEGGAPRVGQTGEWQDRLEQEETVLLDHMVQGYNNMPPLGYCMDCSKSDFLVLTKFMAGVQ